MQAVLTVGGGSKSIAIPDYFAGWRHDLLDIDSKVNPDILADARDLLSQPPGTYDAVYCSHNLEHYHRHDAIKVIRGFHHVLKPDGFAQIGVPDLEAVMKAVVERNLDVDDVLYPSVVGPILVRDVIYGYHVEIEKSGVDFYAHKTGFTVKTLARIMAENGFAAHASWKEPDSFGFWGYYFKQMPSTEQCKLLNLNLKTGE